MRQLHGVVRQALARPDTGADLRAVLETPVPPPGAAGPPVPLAEAAVRHLLKDFTEEQRVALATCAAAREFDSAVDAGLLDGTGDPTLLGDVGARLWLIAPVAEDASTRGGHGSGYLPPDCHPVPLPGRPVLQPWLRLLLLQELAGRPAGERPEWSAVHTGLRDWCEDHARPLDAFYHRLALGELEAVVGRLNNSLRTLPDIDAWLYELYAITAAPLRRPVDTGGSAARRAFRLAEELAPAAFRDHRALTVLVTSLWLATDPRNRLPSPARSLNPTINSMFRELGAHADVKAAGLMHEAHRYQERP